MKTFIAIMIVVALVQGAFALSAANGVVSAHANATEKAIAEATK